jgi:hypothetical protein
MSTNTIAARNPRANSSTLGSLWIVYAILRLVAVILLVLYSGTATVMFGALLTRVPDPYTLMTCFHILYIAAIIVAALSGLFGLFAGLALLAGKSSARGLSRRRLPFPLRPTARHFSRNLYPDHFSSLNLGLDAPG